MSTRPWCVQGEVSVRRSVLSAYAAGPETAPPELSCRPKCHAPVWTRQFEVGGLAWWHRPQRASDAAWLLAIVSGIPLGYRQYSGRGKPVPRPAVVPARKSECRRSESAWARSRRLLSTRRTTEQTVRLSPSSTKRFDGRRRHHSRRMVDAELQGWSRRHRQGAGGSPVSDDRGHRFRRHGRAIVFASALEIRRQA